MSVFLSYGKDESGQLHHISESIAKDDHLTCPFCACAVLPVKGRVRAHHFRHNGESCQESMNEVPSIPGWHHFHLNYPLEVVEALKKGYDPNKPNVFQSNTGWRQNISSLGKHQDSLLEWNTWANAYEFKEDAKVILGSMTLEKFRFWMRHTLNERMQKLSVECENGKHFAWFEIEAERQYKLLNATLYFAQYDFENGDVLYKVGRTNRDVKQRLEETRQELAQATGRQVTQVTLLRQVADCGYVEKYVFHRYAKCLATVNQKTEFLDLDAKAVRQLKGEFTKLANTTIDFDDEVLSKNERMIKSGRWRYEQKRLEASKQAIQAIVSQPDHHFGRPIGTSLSDEDLIRKHPLVASRLLRGQSLRETEKRSEVSLSTVKRVKKALNNSPDIVDVIIPSNVYWQDVPPQDVEVVRRVEGLES